MRWFEVEFQRFPQVGEGLFLGFTLAGDVEFQALGDVPRPLAPDRCGEWSLHDSIVSQARNPRTLTDHRLPPLPRSPLAGTPPVSAFGGQVARSWRDGDFAGVICLTLRGDAERHKSETISAASSARSN